MPGLLNAAKPGRPDLLTTAQVAELTGASIATISRWARTGKLEPAATAKGHVFHRADVLKLVAELATEAEAEAKRLRRQLKAAS